MSKFIERLKQVSQPLPPPMGFGATKATAERPKIQLLASIRDNRVDLMDKLTLVDAVVTSHNSKNNFEKIWGLWLKKGDTVEVQQAIKSGADFAVVPDFGAVLSAEMKIGKVLQLDAAITDMLLRAANELPVDAFLIDHDQTEPLTWQSLMSLYRFGNLVNKPLLVKVSKNVSKDEIRLIWDSGFSGLVVEVDDAGTAPKLENIRESINSLPFPSKKKRDKMSVTLPQLTAPEAEKEPDPDDDDDDA